MFHLEKGFYAKFENYSCSKWFIQLHPVLNTEEAMPFSIHHKNFYWSWIYCKNHTQKNGLTQSFSGWIGGDIYTNGVGTIVTKELLISKNEVGPRWALGRGPLATSQLVSFCYTVWLSLGYYLLVNTWLRYSKPLHWSKCESLLKT